MWTLASGTCWPECEEGWAGTDYGLVRVEDWEPQPAFEAFRAWSSAGTHHFGSIVDGDLRFYPTRDETGRVAVIVVNTRDSVRVPLVVDGANPGNSATLSGATADSLDADRMTEFDGGQLEIGPDGAVVLDLPPHSISVLEIMP
jgi:hypothetical protein